MRRRPRPLAIIPLAVNVILHPLPSPLRCWKLGQALRRAVLSYPEDLDVVVVGTGGLSHQLTGPRFGRVTPEWDQEFMRVLAEEPESLTTYTYEQLIRLGGTESVEVVNWLAMRARCLRAQSASFRRTTRTASWATGCRRSRWQR